MNNGVARYPFRLGVFQAQLALHHAAAQMARFHKLNCLGFPLFIHHKIETGIAHITFNRGLPFGMQGLDQVAQHLRMGFGHCGLEGFQRKRNVLGVICATSSEVGLAFGQFFFAVLRGFYFLASLFSLAMHGRHKTILRTGNHFMQLGELAAQAGKLLQQAHCLARKIFRLGIQFLEFLLQQGERCLGRTCKGISYITAGIAQDAVCQRKLHAGNGLGSVKQLIRSTQRFNQCGNGIFRRLPRRLHSFIDALFLVCCRNTAQTGGNLHQAIAACLFIALQTVNHRGFFGNFLFQLLDSLLIGSYLLFIVLQAQF